MRHTVWLLALVVASASCAEDHKLVETKEAIGVEPAELSFGAISVAKHQVLRVEARNLDSRDTVGVTVEGGPDGYTVTPTSFTIGRSLPLSRPLADSEVRTPFQTVRADFPHTAYRWTLDAQHYTASR